MSIKAKSKKEAYERFLALVTDTQSDVPLSFEERYPRYSDTIEAEELIHSLPQEQLDVLLCIHFGMKAVDIVRVLRFPNVVKYYNVSDKLRKSYQQKKHAYLDYNGTT